MTRGDFWGKILAFLLQEICQIELQKEFWSRFLKPKNEYTDINFGLQVPVPQVDIPYPIFKIGYQDILPWKTWITLNPVHIAKKLWKLVWLGVEVASSIIHIIWNTVDIFKLWGAFHTIHKADLKHPGWSSTSDFFDNPDDWR